jgi:hypothetical protein
MRVKSHLFSTMRGSVAGVTYTANQYHAIVGRQRVSPVQPGTTPQSIVKAAFAGGSTAYELLTDAQRQAWEDYAQTLTYQGPLGDYTVGGRSVAMGQYALSRICVAKGIATIPAASMTAPTTAGFLSIGGFLTDAPSATGTGVNLTITNDNDEDVTVLVELSLKQSDARMRYKGPWVPSTFMGFEVPASTSADEDITGLVDGGVYFMRVRLISSDAPRRLSAPLIIRFVAEATV